MFALACPSCAGAIVPASSCAAGVISRSELPAGFGSGLCSRHVLPSVLSGFFLPYMHLLQHERHLVAAIDSPRWAGCGAPGLLTHHGCVQVPNSTHRR